MWFNDSVVYGFSGYSIIGPRLQWLKPICELHMLFAVFPRSFIDRHITLYNFIRHRHWSYSPEMSAQVHQVLRILRLVRAAKHTFDLHDIRKHTMY